MTTTSRTLNRALAAALLMVIAAIASSRTPLWAQQAPPPPDQPPSTPEIADDSSATEPTIKSEQFDPMLALLKEIDSLNLQVANLRERVAESELQRNEAQRELDELHQFIADNHQFGTDFKQYKAIKEIAEREDRRKEAEANRARFEAEKAERIAKMADARAVRMQRNAEASKNSRYRRMGFSSLGLDVYGGKMAYYYETRDVNPTRIDYVPQLLGSYVRAYQPYSEVDYSRMTISGSVLNGADGVRNIGVAITFFDENGNQVGHETVQINNARPDVPYPFTSKIDMALNRPFASSSTYVLYADSAEGGEGATPEATTTTTPPANSSITNSSGGYKKP